MGLKGPCKVIKIYIDETLKWKHGLLYQAMIELLNKSGIAGVTVYKGIESFGITRHIHSTHILEATEHLPVIIEVIEKSDNALSLLKIIEPMLPTHCLITIQDVQVLHHSMENETDEKN